MGVGSRAIEVILVAYEIPDGSSVRKATGTKVYILRRGVRLHVERGELTVDGVPVVDLATTPKTVGVSGCVMLASGGDITVVSDTTRLAWLTDRGTLLDFLEEERDAEESS